MTEKIIQRGAEAVIILKQNKIIKRRIKKSYRLEVLDERLRKQRTRAEGKLLERASKLIPTTNSIVVDEGKKEISMDFLKGKKLSDNLNDFTLAEQQKVCFLIGQNIAKLHDTDIIHGDLTTSNMIYVKAERNKSMKNIKTKNKQLTINSSSGVGGRGDGGWGNNNSSLDKVFFIDFGLGFISTKIEDKAVDLHLLRQALEAKHFAHWESLFKEVIKGYSKAKDSKLVLKQLEKVEKRGRYKDSY